MTQEGRPQFTDELGQTRRQAFLTKRFGDRGGRIISAILEILEVGVLALALVVLIRTFLVQPFYVKGASMEPTYLDREYLVIDELSYRFHTPSRGDVVVFRYPLDPSEFFIKRVIGLPGETVQVMNGRVSISNEEFPLGRVLDEPYLDGAVTAGSKEVHLKADEYFLLGDHRAVSLDSRIFGPVNRSFIVGRVWLRGWPLDRIATMTTPVYHYHLP